MKVKIGYFVFLVLLQSCVGAYTPGLVYPPDLQEAGDLNVGVSTGTNMYGIQTSYAVNDYLGVQGAFSYTDLQQSRCVLGLFWCDRYHTIRSYGELGFGLYNRELTESLRFDLFGHMSTGRFWQWRRIDGDFESELTKMTGYYLTPSIQVGRGNHTMNFSTRAGLLQCEGDDVWGNRIYEGILLTHFSACYMLKRAPFSGQFFFGVKSLNDLSINAPRVVFTSVGFVSGVGFQMKIKTRQR